MQYMPIFALIILGGNIMISDVQAAEEKEIAIFGGGCFWCMEPPFEQQEGVLEVVAGYSGGTTENPTYELVSAGKTDHYESVRVSYDPKRVSYRELVEIFWRQIDPTDGAGQFADRGEHYKTAIFYSSEEQKEVAEQSKKELGESHIFSDPIVTPVLPATDFYLAEEYHQDYYLKNVMHYSAYKKGSGRAGFIERVWKGREYKRAQYTKPEEKEIKEKLTSLQYTVTQKEGTEPPFENSYWDNKEKGIYVDIVSGEPLFSSKDKFDSGTGWPSFTQPLEAEHIIEKVDKTFLMVRTELRSRYGDSHLGHIFDDGPPPSGLRYCVNSASLRFIPVDELEKNGYGKYREHFLD